MGRKRRKDAADVADAEAQSALVRRLKAQTGASSKCLDRVVNIMRSHQDGANALLDSATVAPFHNSTRAIRQDDNCFVSELIDLKDGGQFELVYADPNYALAAVLATNTELAQAFLKLFHGRVERHLTVVWTQDETFSGNPLHESGRKIWCSSYSFLEFEPHQLAQNAFWITPCVIRSSVLNRIPGGASRLNATLWHRQFRHETAGLATMGLDLRLGESMKRIRSSKMFFIADGDAHKIAFEWKGASSLRCCLKCQNIWSLNSGVAELEEGQYEIDLIDASKFRPHTSKTLLGGAKVIFESRRQHADKRITLRKLKEIATAVGLTPTEFGIWKRPQLVTDFNIPKIAIYDWVHSLLQDGAFTSELLRFLSELPDGSAATFNDFYDGWRWTGTEVRHVVRSITAAMRGKRLGGHSRLTATQTLAAATLLRCWAEVSGVSSEKSSFVACCDLISSIQMAKFMDAGDSVAEHASLVGETWSNWLAINLENHDQADIIPKAHWLGHMEEQILACGGRVLDTFVTERLNRRAKSITEKIRNTQSFEASVVASLLLRSKYEEIHVDKVGVKSCISINRTIREGMFIKHKKLHTVGRVKRCTKGPGEEIMLFVDVHGDVRMGAKRSPFWNHVACSPSHDTVWTASGCDLAFGWNALVGRGVLVLSCA